MVFLNSTLIQESTMKERAGSTYRLRLYPYSGGLIDLHQEGTLADCRDQAARIITRHRNTLEYPVSILEPGFKWELETGDEAAIIGDTEGLLTIEELPEPEPDDRDEEDGYDTTIECEECGDLVPAIDAIDGLCSRCWNLLDEEEVD
jgi:hypothetical protein